MSPTTPTPDLTSYRLVHVALRLAPHRLAGAVAGIDPADRRRVTALARYWRGYAGEVLAHHTVEDHTFFPALVERVPVAAELIERTDREHHRLDELMERAGAGVVDLERGRRSDLGPVLRELAVHMDHHLAFEDADILPLFERHFSADEYHQLDRAAMKSLGIGRQAAFTLPFVAAVMDDDTRRQLLGKAPAPLRVLHRLATPAHERLSEAVFGPPQPGRRVEGVL